VREIESYQMRREDKGPFWKGEVREVFVDAHTFDLAPPGPVKFKPGEPLEFDPNAYPHGTIVKVYVPSGEKGEPS
jgi:hypothetical protein